MAAEQYDAIVIGSGQGGNPLAEALAAAGRKTALIERKHLGGTCINDGCTPTKTMVASARVAYLAGRGSEYGVGVPGAAPPQMQMQVVRQRKRSIVNDFRGAKEKRLGSTKNLEVIWGEASFVAPRTLNVKLRDGGTRTVSAEQIFINTGTRPAVPKLEGLDKVAYLDNVSIMELDAVPTHLLILGGGYIGVEFAQMFRRFGAQVSIVHAGAHLLEHEDPDMAEEVQKIFAEDGISVHLDARATRASQNAEGIALTISQGSGEKTIHGSHLLVAVGRVPNTSELNLQAAGIDVDAGGYIRANERLETSAAGVFVIGDVKGGPAFTHISYDDFRILRANLLDGKSATTAGRMVPYTVFMDPELGRIGMTEAEATRGGRKVRIARMRMTSVARALETAESRGVMKVVIDADGERILGAAILGIGGGEIASMLQLAMMGGLSVSTLRDAVFSHPTLAESLNNLFLNIE
jgi:pyruvate/2-oxoglutarate dehydrogenase complex dihydrolipoamide dehydrogenase (E3) component